jgi:RHS repeat-associated protein
MFRRDPTSTHDQIVENVTTGSLYFQDSLGNTSHVTGAAGNLLERHIYNAFSTPSFLSANNTQLSTSAYGIKHLFQGQLWTQETGLNDYRNRVELLAMGVFLQPDPIGFKGDAANVYRFCNNNAVNRIDPLGLRDWEAVRQAMDGCNLLGFFQAEAAAAMRTGWSTVVPNLTMATETRSREGSSNHRQSDPLHNLDLPGAIKKLEAALPRYAADYGSRPGYPDGRAVVEALKKAYAEGRIRPGGQSEI